MTEKKSKLLAVIRVRGQLHLHEGLKKTFELLNLHNKNWCVIMEDTPTNRGMLAKVKDYVTWGNISEDTMENMLKSRAEEFKGRLEDSSGKIKYNKFFEYKGKKYKKYIRLNPPLKGYGRKGVKVGFAKGGALGDRKEKINDLIERMI